MPKDTSAEKDLIERAKKGDEDAFQKLLNLYKGRIFSYLLRLVKNYHDAEELAFEVFIKVFHSLKSFDASRSFSSWLFTIAHNLVIDFYRKNRIEYEYLNETSGSFAEYIERYEREKERANLEKALMQLPAIDREIIILFHKEEYSYQEIGEILKLPVSTIKIRLHRARRRLRKLLCSG